MNRVGVVAAILLSLLVSAGCAALTSSRNLDGINGQVGRLRPLRVAVESPARAAAPMSRVTAPLCS